MSEQIASGNKAPATTTEDNVNTISELRDRLTVLTEIAKTPRLIDLMPHILDRPKTNNVSKPREGVATYRLTAVFMLRLAFIFCLLNGDEFAAKLQSNNLFKIVAFILDVSLAAFAVFMYLREKPSVVVDSAEVSDVESDSLSSNSILENPMEPVHDSTSNSNSSYNNESHPWGKGTGYGCAIDCQDWDMNSWKMEQDKKYKDLTNILVSISRLLDDSESEEALHAVVYSGLVPFCIEEMTAGSVSVMSHRKDFYCSLFDTVNMMAKHEPLQPILTRNIQVPDKSAMNLWQIFGNLESQAAKVGSLSSMKLDGDDIGGYIIDTYQQIAESMHENVLNNDTEEEKEEKEESKEQQISYNEAMEDVRFDSCETFGRHHFANEAGTVNRKLMRRLAGEYSDISVDLPLNEESSIFARISEDHMDLAQFLVVPADGTPYASGCFIFDVSFPSDYPNSPPHVNLATTGGGTVRFNPNLYETGYVCLSLLGTWGAQGEGEQWQPNLSTFLQVCISVQALIFVPDPYWNEPGYEAYANDPHNKAECERYNKDKQTNTVRFAMIDLLVNPPPEFQTAIFRHFYLSKTRVIRNATEWLGDQHELVRKLTALLEQLDESCLTDNPTAPVMDDKCMARMQELKNEPPKPKPTKPLTTLLSALVGLPAQVEPVNKASKLFGADSDSDSDDSDSSSDEELEIFKPPPAPSSNLFGSYEVNSESESSVGEPNIFCDSSDSDSSESSDSDSSQSQAGVKLFGGNSTSSDSDSSDSEDDIVIPKLFEDSDESDDDVVNPMVSTNSEDPVLSSDDDNNVDYGCLFGDSSDESDDE